MGWAVPVLDAHLAVVPRQRVAAKADRGGQVPPVAAGADGRETQPVQRREQRQAVQLVAVSCRRRRQFAQDLAHGAHAPLRRLAHGVRAMLHVARDEEEAGAPLRETTELAAVMRPLVGRVAGLLQQLDDLAEQLRAAGRHARHVLEEDERRQLRGPGTESEIDAPESEARHLLVLFLPSPLSGHAA
ncbi:hypothetical protein OV079_00220 [Nannocystis pusilla]|uniref:Uncharacterized protein n=1 Tax=Nannocystis pusilla TaxID=889268 RepID=A0A9X3ITI0_9BACT|nr:hypothetical protein [Nannocystis pusilla]MCY1004017.1 hypothetical protein [Nannocystis pusilla]